MSSVLLLCSALAFDAPGVVILEPLNGRVLRSSAAGLHLRARNFKLGVDGILCIDILWDKGKSGQCFDDAATWHPNGTRCDAPDVCGTLTGLESDVYAVIATLRDEADGLQLGSPAYANFKVALDHEPPKLHISYPRSGETITTSKIELGFNIKNFGADKGFVCVSMDKPLGTPGLVHDVDYHCLLPNRTTWKLPASAAPGEHTIYAALFDREGKSLGEGVEADPTNSQSTFMVASIGTSHSSRRIQPVQTNQNHHGNDDGAAGGSGSGSGSSGRSGSDSSSGDAGGGENDDGDLIGLITPPEGRSGGGSSGSNGGGGSSGSSDGAWQALSREAIHLFVMSCRSLDR
jgi:hypothetical protein